MQATVLSALKSAITTLGDLVLAGQRAAITPVTHVPGQPPSVNYVLTDALVVLLDVKSEDYPGTSIEIFDRTLLDLMPSTVSKVGDFYKIGSDIYKSVAAKRTDAGQACVLMQHLVRPDNAVGVVWT